MADVEKEIEVSFTNILEALKQYNKIIISASLIAGVAATVLVNLVMIPQWEASGILQVGQVGQFGQTGVKLAEPISNAIARINHPSFEKEIVNFANFSKEELTATKSIFAGSIKAEKLKDADLIEFKLRGYSPEMTRKLANATVGLLQKIHGDAMSPSLLRITEQIKSLAEDIRTLKSESDYLKKKLLGTHEWNSYNATLAATVLQNKGSQLREAIQKKQFLEEQLNASNSFTTKVVGEVVVPEDAVSPKKGRIILIGMLVGLIFGTIFAFLHKVYVKSIP